MQGKICDKDHTITSPTLSKMITFTKVNDAPLPVTAASSFKPHARGLSHELRTPMHGVIGMLDMMHATVQEAIESEQNPKVRKIFQALRENIEVVQGIKALTFPLRIMLIYGQTVLAVPLRRQTILFMLMR